MRLWLRGEFAVQGRRGSAVFQAQTLVPLHGGGGDVDGFHPGEHVGEFRQTDLLGCHVAHRAHDDTRTREGVGDLRGLIGPGGASQFGHTEVQDFHASIASEKQVLRLQVAMDDAAVVRRGESLRDLHSVVDGLAFRKGAAPQPLAERLSFEQL